MAKHTGIIILLAIGAIALIAMIVFGGGGLLSIGHSGSASGQAGSGGSGLLNSGGAGGLTSNPSLSSSPTATGAKSSNSAMFGNQSGANISLGNVSTYSANGSSFTNYKPFIYAPTNEEQSYTTSTYAPVTNTTTNIQQTKEINAPNTGAQVNVGNPFLWWTKLLGGG